MIPATTRKNEIKRVSPVSISKDTPGFLISLEMNQVPKPAPEAAGDALFDFYPPEQMKIGRIELTLVNLKQELVDYAEFLGKVENLPDTQRFRPCETLVKKLASLKQAITTKFPDKTLPEFSQIRVKVPLDQPVWIDGCNCRGILRTNFAAVKPRELMRLRLGIRIQWTLEHPDQLRVTFLARGMEVVPPFSQPLPREVIEPPQEERDMPPPPYRE